MIGPRTLKRFARDKSVIMTEGSGPCPVFSRGDRRTVPTHWLSRDTVRALQSDETFVAGPRGLTLAPSASARLLNPVAERAFSEQHGPKSAPSGQEREIYTPDGSVRRARVNTTFSSLRRIARTKTRDDKPALSAPLIEAGERFARDYASLSGGIATQNYAAAAIDNTARHSATAQRYAYQIDAGRRLAEARKALGPKLEKTVIAICCNEHDLAALERAEGWVAKSGLVVLRLGLETLRDHYGTQSGRRRAS